MNAAQLSALHRRIHTWYARYGRKELPWRTTDDPYAIWISEVMLQQTQVKTVLERYYRPFLERFPTLEALSQAPLQEVLKQWEGLGYYTRAKNLHRCAKITAPKLPETYEALLALPGIGPNTATAICVFAYRHPVAVMEANVKRILCRLHRIKHPTDAQLRRLAATLLDRQNPFDYNQAMMDIGATLCTPKAPDCPRCPFQPLCGAYAHERFDYPVKKGRRVPTKKSVIEIETAAQGVFMQRRTGNFLHGLWGFKEVDHPHPRARFLAKVTHRYTHFALDAAVYLREADPHTPLLSYERIAALPLSGVDRKIVDLLVRKGIFS